MEAVYKKIRAGEASDKRASFDDLLEPTSSLATLYAGT
jgi:hypothetical protein